MFGLVFQSSFARNISYAFGGATSLKKEGMDATALVLDEPNIPLIKGLIISMRRFYGLITLVFIVILSVFRSFYIAYLTQKLPDKMDILYSWIVYSLSIAFGFYCFIYSSILLGRGYIKELNQLIILYKFIFVAFVYAGVSHGYGIWSIAIANSLSMLINFVTGYCLAYKNNLRKILKETNSVSRNLMQIIWSNTYKLSLSTMFSYFSTKGNIFYISLFLPLGLIARYGLTLQVVNVLTTISLLYYYSYSPMIAQDWITKNIEKVRILYSKSLLVAWVVFIIGAAFILIFGNRVLELIGSHTSFLPFGSMLLIFLVYLLDVNHSLAIHLIVSFNRVPHLLASGISALAIFLLIPVFTKYFDGGIYAVVMVVGVVQLCYHNWKWPKIVSRVLGMSFTQQIRLGINSFLKRKEVTDE